MPPSRSDRGGTRRRSSNSPPAARLSRARTPSDSVALAPVYQRRHDRDASHLLETEWLLTDGAGGFAMGTALGAPARRYHGMLIWASTPPVGRISGLVAMIETIRRRPADRAGSIEQPLLDLSTFEFAGDGATLLHPRGHELLSAFEHCPSRGWCQWTFKAGGTRVRKRLQLLRAVRETHEPLRPGAVLTYAVESDVPITLEIGPLVSLRGFHDLERAHGLMRVESAEGRALVSRGAYSLGFAATSAGDAPVKFVERQDWWKNFSLRFEADRRQDCLQDLFVPGGWSVQVGADGEKCISILATVGAPGESVDPARLATDDADGRATVLDRRVAATGVKNPSVALRALVAAAEDFVVIRTGAGNRRLTSVIAGYPWFGDWGRDTLTCVRGLLLATGRHDEAFNALECFAGHARNGLIPNLFDERTGEAQYNTVDASLLFIHAAIDWLEAAGDIERFRARLLPVCLAIVRAYREGADTGEGMIGEDPADRLICAGNPASQLTWMDARRDGVVFTPRHGKPVEVNALWHSALRRLADATQDESPSSAADLRGLAGAVRKSFAHRFWNEHAGCLFDCLVPDDLGGWRPSAEIRPNQLFAVSLPHSPLSGEQQRSVVSVVRARLLTPDGIRTLDPADPNYRPRYEGSLFERDRAYHNGTVWPWLLGPYIEAELRVGGFSPESRARAASMLAPILARIDGHCPGQLPEVFDGEARNGKRRPGGCPAQAWSVAELLRVALLIERPRGAAGGR